MLRDTAKQYVLKKNCDHLTQTEQSQEPEKQIKDTQQVTDTDAFE